MNRPLRILHLEDDPDYSELVRSLLRDEGIEAEMVLVNNRGDFEAALVNGNFDILLADYTLPGYNGLRALEVAHRKCPHTPFLLVSGTIAEHAAIESLKLGATDYVLKHWPERLVPAVRRAVGEAEERSQRRRIESELERRERYFRTLTENSVDVLSLVDREAKFLYSSPSVERVLGYTSNELKEQTCFNFIHPDDRQHVENVFAQALRFPERLVTVEFRFKHKNGSWRYFESIGQNRLADADIGALVINSREITDRKKAEDKLRESEQQYRLIFDGNPTPMWVFDHETLAFLEVNDATVHHYGFSRDELLRLTVKDIRPAEDVPAMVEYLHRLLAADVPRTMGYAGVWRHRKKDGTLIDVEIKWSPISFKGRPASLVMANDITDRKRIEDRNAAISKLGQSLSSAMSPAEAAQIIKAVADDLFKWDAFTLDVYSTEDNTVHPILNVDTNREGQRFEIPLPAQDRNPSQMARRIIEKGGELILREEPLAAADDSTLIGDTSRLSASLLLAPVRNRTKVIGILSVQSYAFKAYDRADLSMLQTLADHCGGALERIHAEQALRESEMLFHSVWQNSVDGMRLTDQDGTIVAVNDAFCNLVGMNRTELEGKPFTVIYAASEQPEKLLQGYRERFGNRLVEKHVERRLTLRNGQSVAFEDSSSFVELPGRPPLLFGLFRDVTVQKRLEDQLRQSQKMEAIGQLAGGVAHDFNNILTVIHGHASLLLSGGSLAPLATRSAQQITQAADRAATLTRQLLTFSRRQVMQPRRLDMNEVVSNMTQMLGRILGEDIALQLSYFPQPALVHADAGMMEQVLLNLAVNSRDAMPNGGLLAIRIALENIDSIHLALHSDAHTGKHVCLSVIDTGCGIAPENLRRVFEPFFTTKEVGKGTGLGLATVYGIVKQHQGWLEIESQLGRGTGFKVYLPATNEPVETQANHSPEPVVRGGSETILVVEDEAPVRELVCSLLGGHGYNILQAECGREALMVWQNNKDKVDLLLTDLVMPDRMSGRELAEKIWAERPKLRVIFTSGYSADAVGKDFVLRRGMNYLQKPYHPKKLAIVVRDCLDAVS